MICSGKANPLPSSMLQKRRGPEHSGHEGRRGGLAETLLKDLHAGTGATKSAASIRTFCDLTICARRARPPPDSCCREQGARRTRRDCRLHGDDPSTGLRAVCLQPCGGIHFSLNKQWLPACPPRRWAWEGTRQPRETQSVQRNSRWASEEAGRPEWRAHVLRIQGGVKGQKNPSAGKPTGEAEVKPGSCASRPREGPGTRICCWDQNKEEQQPPSEVGITAWGLYLSDNGWNPGPLQWDCRALDNKSPQKSLAQVFEGKSQLPCSHP